MYLKKADEMLNPLRNIADKLGAPLFDLMIRLYMAQIFFHSGWLKLQNLLNDDWGSTLFQFEEVSPVPGIPAGIAAAMAMFGELVLSSMLALGLFARFAAAGLLVMTLVIQFAVPASYGLQNDIHYFWMLLFLSVFIKGPGTLSADHFVRKWIHKN